MLTSENFEVCLKFSKYYFNDQGSYTRVQSIFK